MTASPDEATAPIFRLDRKAVRSGGERAGKYLQTLGRYDLSQLSADEWERFCFILVAGTFTGAIDAYVDEIGCNSEIVPF